MSQHASSANSADPTPMPTETDIARLSNISRKFIGIELKDQKADFIRSRLDVHLKNLGLRSYAEYCEHLEHCKSGQDRLDFSESLTTNTTRFFREIGHFDWLRTEGIGCLVRDGAGQMQNLTVWSAACSTGQELYSALMTIDITTKSNRIRYNGIGTDFSPAVLKTAKRAIYDLNEISSIPEDMRPGYLLSSKKHKNVYRIAPEIRNKTEWKEANLIDRSTMNDIKADLIFLRNVLIYFSAETQEKVLENVLSKLRLGGFLLTGHTETNGMRLRDLRSIRPTIYQKVA